MKSILIILCIAVFYAEFTTAKCKVEQMYDMNYKKDIVIKCPDVSSLDVTVYGDAPVQTVIMRGSKYTMVDECLDNKDCDLSVYTWFQTHNYVVVIRDHAFQNNITLQLDIVGVDATGSLITATVAVSCCAAGFVLFMMLLAGCVGARCCRHMSDTHCCLRWWKCVVEGFREMGRTLKCICCLSGKRREYDDVDNSGLQYSDEEVDSLVVNDGEIP